MEKQQLTINFEPQRVIKLQEVKRNKDLYQMAWANLIYKGSYFCELNGVYTQITF
jgi:hypothetical protein